MPKQVITQSMILDAALEIAREQGYERVNARSVAEWMGRSVQPIYSYFRDMDDMKAALYRRAMAFYDASIRENADRTSLVSMAQANIRFAKREPKLFRLLFLAKSDEYRGFEAIYQKMGIDAAARGIADNSGISYRDAAEIYVMMIVFTHGIAAMLVTGGADLDDAEIDRLIKEAYRSFVERKERK